MNRLPTVTPKKLVTALKRAGFVESGQKGSHLYLWHPTKKVQTCVPVHPKDLKRGLLKLILKQSLFSETDFQKFL